MQVVEALHEQIADLSALLAELRDERCQQENIPDQEEFGGLSLDCLPLRAPSPSLPLAQKGGDGGENDVIAPPSGSPISVRKSVSAFFRNSMGVPGP